MKKWKPFALAVAVMALLSLNAVATPPPFHHFNLSNLSGYEFLLGSPCPGGTGTCGVSFLGWTGGKGAEANGWQAFAGNNQALWQSTVNYSGSPAFDASVTVTGGVFNLLSKHGQSIEGAVSSGTVTWPADANTDIGCGAGVATVNLSLLTGPGGPTNFQGCLHDLPAGSIIPPKIWGTLY